MDREEIVCHCFQISRGQIIDAVKEKGLKTVEDVNEAIDAGSACGGCNDEIQEIIDSVNA